MPAALNNSTKIAAVMPKESANTPTICGVTIPPSAAIARNMDIPVFEPFNTAPALDTLVG